VWVTRVKDIINNDQSIFILVSVKNILIIYEYFSNIKKWKT